MSVALLAHVLNDGDAVGHDLLGMARALRAAGRTVALFADRARVSEDVHPLDAAVGRRFDAIIYHHSIRCDAALRVVESATGPVAVKYHNVTPPRFFAGLDPAAADRAAGGQMQAARLADRGAVFWTDSAFNARDLPVPAAELPPFHQADELDKIAPDSSAAPGLDDWGTLVVCVGRVAPNKNLTLAVEAFAEFRRQFDPDARLLLVGEHEYDGYSAAVVERIQAHTLADAVTVTGRVTAAQLKAVYAGADALLVTSEHEGFCVPLVEAMALGVPAVAVPIAAVPDTAGDAARYADPDPQALAAGLWDVVSDGPLRERLVHAGRRRYAERFAPAAIERRFLELFDALVAVPASRAA